MTWLIETFASPVGVPLSVAPAAVEPITRARSIGHMQGLCVGGPIGTGGPSRCLQPEAQMVKPV